MLILTIGVIAGDSFGKNFWWSVKLDGVGLVDNRPSTNKLHHFVRKKRRKKMWHVTRDTWHVTHDMTRDVTRDVTRDTWHVTCLGGWTLSQNFSSLALTVCDLWYYEYLEEKDESLNEWMSDEAVYRTAPATPGLLKMCFRPKRELTKKIPNWV